MKAALERDAVDELLHLEEHPVLGHVDVEHAQPRRDA